jgi:hypothetical protein
LAKSCRFSNAFLDLSERHLERPARQVEHPHVTRAEPVARSIGDNVYQLGETEQAELRHHEVEIEIANDEFGIVQG